MDKNLFEEGPNPKKKLKTSIISDHIYSNEFQRNLRFYGGYFRDVMSENFEIIINPFKVFKISNFFKNEEFISELKNELSHVETKRNVMDLYQFEQSKSLVNVKRKNIKLLVKTLQTDMTSWMQRNMGVSLNGKISMSSSCYFDTDYLLCHDDNMEDRKIAFILYLSKNWSMEDGGTLDLFDTDENNLPRNIVKSIVPEYNSIVFFEVVTKSYHQVAEIVSPGKCRWSINGWFHGPVTRSYKPRPIIFTKLMQSNDTKINLKTWVTPCYLNHDIIKDIQLDMENNSYTFLPYFLHNTIYNKITADLTSQSICWEMIGPANMRHYEKADETTFPKLLKEFCEIFKSISMFKLLQQYTELDLVPTKENIKPKMTLELQRWSAGCYTLMYDRSVAHPDFDDNEGKSQIDLKEEMHSSITEDYQIACTSSDKKNISSESETYSSIKEDDDVDEDHNLALAKKTKRRTMFYRRKLFGKKERSTTPEMTSETESSDVTDYLSSREQSPESMKNDSPKIFKGTLEAIMQFRTSNVSTDETIDYVDPHVRNGTIIQIPYKDNYLCLVYKMSNIQRLHKYINHHNTGYFYNLICTYHE